MYTESRLKQIRNYTANFGDGYSTKLSAAGIKRVLFLQGRSTTRYTDHIAQLVAGRNIDSDYYEKV